METHEVPILVVEDEPVYTILLPRGLKIQAEHFTFVDRSRLALARAQVWVNQGVPFVSIIDGEFNPLPEKDPHLVAHQRDGELLVAQLKALAGELVLTISFAGARAIENADYNQSTKDDLATGALKRITEEARSILVDRNSKKLN